MRQLHSRARFTTRSLLAGAAFCLAAALASGQINHLQAAANFLNQGDTAHAESEARLALRSPDTKALALAMLGTIRLQQSKYAESVELLKQALALNPRLVGARTTLGDAYVLQGDPEDARNSFKQALKRDPGNLNARSDWAKLESTTNNFQRSIEIAEPILPQLSQTEEGLLLLARDYAALGRKAELSAVSAKWERLPSSSYNASIDFAGLLAAQRLTPQATEILQATETKLAAHPSAPVAQRLAQAYLALRNLERAQSNSLLALSLDSGCAACFLTAAQIAEQEGITEKALSYLVRAKKLEPDNPQILFEFGKVCLLRDLLDDALPALERAVELQPDRDQYVYVLASGYVGQAKLENAVSLLSGLLRKHPQDATFNYALGTVYYLQRKYSDAEASFKASLASQPDQVGSSYYLALTYDDLGQGAQAAVVLRDLLKKHPDHAPSLLKLGTILSREGQYVEAEDFLRHAVSLDPNSAGAHYSHGVVLRRLGKTAESEEEFAESRKVHNEQESQTHMHLHLLLPE